MSADLLSEYSVLFLWRFVRFAVFDIAVSGHQLFGEIVEEARFDHNGISRFVFEGQGKFVRSYVFHDFIHVGYGKFVFCKSEADDQLFVLHNVIRPQDHRRDEDGE